MIPSPHNISKLKNQKLQASKSKVHQKISNTFIECAIQKNTVGALKTIYYLSGAIETIENLYKLEKDTLITIKIDTRDMLKYTEMSLPDIKRNIKSMQQTSVSFIDNSDDTEIGVSLLPYYKFIYGKHIIELKIFVKIAYQIIDVKRNYSMIDIKSLMKFRSKHTLKFLPLLYRISQYSKDVSKRKTFELHEFNSFFGTNYKKFYDIERYILRPVKDELDNNSKISFIYETNYDYFDAGRPKAISMTIDVIQKKSVQGKLI